ncbi:hypothetical protein O0I10_008939 [Lichtheimia ornata]|uniref:RlpA-like protein double-psi beta-barrel domain-containing protein n=1 Tax=Lichtheimia ornata TaxID=688661 RepID=A0AAD7XUY5_9FUNG|nr:uncharacterized protein O0I10_008939 [Lichtheimia ornata]KAJ8655445.1 hypothetical protein O0I10_008939 [Lichtheimia ornata]
MARQFIPIFLCLLVLSLCALAAPIEKRGKKYKGQGTYYTPGLGSCGIESTAKDMIAALNAPQMGSSGNPNSNKNCGKKVKVKGPKGSVTVKIIDTCPGCAKGDLDLSPAAFARIADLDDGRVSITWSF